MKGNWSSGKIVAVVLGSIGACTVLVVTLYIGVFQFVKGFVRFRTMINEAQVHQQQETDRGKTDPVQEDRDRVDVDPDVDENDRYDDGEYYEIQDAIRKDLSYQVDFDMYYSMPEDNVYVEISYPVITGDETIEAESINNIIQREIEEVESYAESVTEWISDEESFTFEADSYVTYMDEDVLSIIYVEYGYLDGADYESYIISVNIDMKSGLALTNSQLLNIDDEFSIDFRNRCERQNGEIQSLSMYSDQDITTMLTDDSSLIIFYTPLGMEVGFNYYYGWVTVTYQDYQKYQSHF